MGAPFKIISTLILVLSFSSCMKNNTQVQSSATTAAEAVGCDNLQSKVFDSMYAYLDQEKEVPNLDDLKTELSKQIDQIVKTQKINDAEKISEFKSEFYKIFEILIADTKNVKNISSVKEHLQSLIELEMNDTTSTANIQLNSKVSKQFSKVSVLAKDLNIQCTADLTLTAAAPSSSVAAPVNAQSRMIAGQNNVFSTAYQSCQSLQIPEVNSSTPDVSGIVRVGTHPDGIGGVRDINNLQAVQETHPYIRIAAGAQNGCFNVRSKPLIYDYGGEPNVANNTLNFFQNSGDGSKTTLGIDCSAYISSAIAAAGFRYKPGVDNKAVFVRQSSAKFISAKDSGFTCFDNITLTRAETIKPGDIAGVHGHVVMVDKVSADPFGIKKLSNVSQCASLGIDNFDFTISQSSPEKNGMGINKFIAKDYLAAKTFDGKMRVLFTEMAKAQCQAYFGNKAVKPSNSNWGIIRHNGKPECLAPRIQMVSQSCVSQCQN